jgi:integrase/recombinase XerC
MARPATGTVITRRLANGDIQHAIKFRVHGRRVYETLGLASEGWDKTRTQETLKDRLAEVRLGTYVPPRPGAETRQNAADDEPTFHEFASRWLAMVAPELKQSTVEAIRWRLSYVLLPFFQHHRLSEITISEVDRYRAAKVRERDLLIAAREAGEQIDRRPLSNSTINRTISLLGQILEVAVEYGHLPANPARGKRRKLKAAKPQRAYLDSAAQIVALLDAAADLDRESRVDRQHVNRRAQLATLIFSGLRISEFLALRWRDVDLAGGWLTVGEAKTDAGRRKVKIRPVLRDVLSELRAVPRNQALPQNGDGLVFGTSAGTPQNPSNVRRRIVTRSVERANERLAERGEAPLPALTPHGLRRSFASLLYGIGEPPPVVMQEMGHTDPALALSIYAHAMRRDEGENERLRALIEGADLAGLVTSDHSEAVEVSVRAEGRQATSRSTSGV